MKGICPYCEKETSLRYVHATETLKVRGESIDVPVTYLQCEECGRTFDDPNSPNDPVDAAYREYRRRHNLLQPDEIRSFRNSLGLTQKELSTLLGWGGATLSRYENGALQDDAHDKLLRLAMEPRNLIELVEANLNALTPATSARILGLMRDLSRQQQLSIRALCDQYFSQHEPDEFNGYRSFDVDRFLGAVLFFCSGQGVFKTKLNKLLFYADFKHFKDFSISITGSRYAHLPYGPAPDRYEIFLAVLHDEDKSIEIEERDFPGYVGEILVAKAPPDISSFSPSELRVLSQVLHDFAGLTAKQLSDRSHTEKGYRETSNGELISYTYASNLSL